MSFLDIPELDGYKAFVDQSFVGQSTAELPPVEYIAGGAYPIVNVHMESEGHMENVGLAFGEDGYDQESFPVPADSFPPLPAAAGQKYSPLCHQDGYVADFAGENGHYEGNSVVETGGQQQWLSEPSPPPTPSPSQEHHLSSSRQPTGKRIAPSKDPAIKSRVAAVRKDRTPQPSGASGDTRKRLQPTASVIQQVTPDNHLLQFGDSSKPVISRKRSNSLPESKPPCLVDGTFAYLFFVIYSVPQFPMVNPLQSPMFATMSGYNVHGVPQQVFVPVANVTPSPRTHLLHPCVQHLAQTFVTTSSSPRAPFPFSTQHQHSQRTRGCAILSRSRRALLFRHHGQTGPGPSKSRQAYPPRNLASHDFCAHAPSFVFPRFFFIFKCVDQREFI